MKNLEKVESELLYLRARITDVDARAENSPNLSARIAYSALGRLYRDRIARLSGLRVIGKPVLQSETQGAQL